MGTHLVTGAAGFVGCNLTERLLTLGHTVILVDDLSAGAPKALEAIMNRFQSVHFIQTDCANGDRLAALIRQLNAPPIGDLWHLAANSDIAAGVDDFRIDVQRTLMTTLGILSMLKELGPACVHFASSSAVYGDRGHERLCEATGRLEPISYYGAMKLGSEAVLRAAAESFLPRINVFRFANIVGTPATHGVIHDFVGRLLRDPARLTVLGNGTQQKPYLHVTDLIDAMLFVRDSATGSFNLFNIGPEDDGVSVADIARLIVSIVSPDAAISFGTEDRGWVGDVPIVRFSNEKLAKLGWQPQRSSEQAVRQAAIDIVAQGLRA